MQALTGMVSVSVWPQAGQVRVLVVRILPGMAAC
jgi:hypothetical protein